VDYKKATLGREKGGKAMIKGVIFDIEEAIWKIEEATAEQENAAARAARLTGFADGRAFMAVVSARYASYRVWAETEQKEAGDFELWHSWLLPELDEEYLRKVCHDLTSEYRKTEGIRRIIPGSLRTVRTLYDRGYRLGVISNHIGEKEVPLWLEESGEKQYFDAVILSPVCKIRRPDPAIYKLACEELGLEPRECASISAGDAAGEKGAGIGVSIQVSNERTSLRGADYTVQHILEVLELPELR